MVSQEQPQIKKIQIRDIEKREFGFEMGTKKSGKAPFIRKMLFGSISDIEKFMSKKNQLMPLCLQHTGHIHNLHVLRKVVGKEQITLLTSTAKMI